MGIKEGKKPVSRLDKLKQREPGRVKLNLSRVTDDLDKHPVSNLISAANAQEAARHSSSTSINAGSSTIDDLVSKLATPLTTPLITPLTTPPATPLMPHMAAKEDNPLSSSEKANLENAQAFEQGTTKGSLVEEARPRTATTPKFEYLDATHTGAEQRIYSVMYRRTISAGHRERHFGMKELLEQTGIKAQQTIRTAIDGLITKRSVEIVEYKNGNPFGPRYRVYEPREITKRREAFGIVIDPVTKKVRTDKSETLSDQKTDVDPSNHPSSYPSNDASNTPSNAPPKNWRGTPLNNGGVTPLNFRGVYINIENEDIGGGISTSSSSSEIDGADDDEEKRIEVVRSVYEQITGNEFTAADMLTLKQAREVPALVWGYSICVCIDRAPNHRFGRLAYVLEQAKRDWEDFREQGIDKDKKMQEMMLRMTLSRIRRARETGDWSPAPEKTHT